MLLNFIVLAACLSISAAPDTLETATIVADRGVVVSRSDTLNLKDALSITDALGSVAGLYVGDCGGSAGLKTISLRGMGSAHTSVYIDGVRVSNIQSGQPDMGMPGIGDFASASVDYAQNSISFTTAKPVFDNRTVAGRFRLRAGSFATYEPYGRLDFRLSDKLSMSASASGTFSRGDFPIDGGVRMNNDIKQVRGGMDLWGLINGGDWHAKAFCNGAERGTPGTSAWPSGDRQKDRNAFVQGVMRKSFSPIYTLTLSAKAAYDKLQYISEWGDSDYAQSGLQINSSHRFRINGWLDISAAADLQYDALESSLYNGSRTSAVAAAASSIHPGRLRAELAIEYNGTFDRGEKARNSVSPSMSVRYNILNGLDIVAFGRRAFRMPTFNELYYPGYGNPELRAERAWLSDLGLEWHSRPSKGWSISAKADGFMNSLHDKITSAPTVEDPNIWLPYNIGAVRMCGVDIQGGATFERCGWKAAASARYSFQSAVDITRGSASFGEQIPYVARNSASLSASMAKSGWRLGAIWNMRSGRRDSTGEMPDWCTLDMNFGKKLAIRGIHLELIAMALNITDCRYELASGYPMPGRSFTGGIEVKF